MRGHAQTNGRHGVREMGKEGWGAAEAAMLGSGGLKSRAQSAASGDGAAAMSPSQYL